MIRRSLLCIISLIFFLAGATGEYENCTGQLNAINDGRCDGENNIAECAYDGGDCCYCSCENDHLYPCGVWGYTCLDPGKIGNDGNCTNETALVNPCSTSVSQTWTINDTVSATSLAEAVNCSGGTFEVRWQGNVLIDHTISITNGTTVYMTGEGPGAEVNGGGKKRLFTVEDAALYLDGLTLSDGNATYGGAIAAKRSILSLNHTFYSGNIASSYGGAVCISTSSSVTWSGQTTFAGNHGGQGGGAVAVSSNSTAAWNGSTYFSNNTSSGDGGSGGAVNVDDHSRVSWAGMASFNNNNANWSGGALFVHNNSIASWDGLTSFVANTADFGGAVNIRETSSISSTAETSFIDNKANEQGGAVRITSDSAASWNGNTTFVANSARSGGAISVEENSIVSSTAETCFINNTASRLGGAFHLLANSIASWDSVAFFTANTAELGGAVYIRSNSSVSWTAETFFINNNASGNGGALRLYNDSTASWDGNTTFIANTATWGGAVRIDEYSTVSWIAETTFLNNSASDNGGALFIGTSSTASWEGLTSFVANSAAFGGAMNIHETSSVSSTAETTFTNNKASKQGGAVRIVADSAASWNGKTTFVANSARFGGAINVEENSIVLSTAKTCFINNTASRQGGAFRVLTNSIASWDNTSSFIANTADAGGAVYASINSSVSWTAETSFRSNMARDHGGALRLYTNSTASWDGNTTFAANTATRGGAVRIDKHSTVSWTAETLFISNSASGGNGGALFSANYSAASWDGLTSFVSNTAADFGGAFYVAEESAASWNGVTSFIENTANYGGAISVHDQSTASWTAETSFVNNAALTGDGGALRLRFESTASWTGKTLFSENRANTSGGAVYVSTGANVTVGGDTHFLDNDADVHGGAIFVYVGYDQAVLSHFYIDDDVAIFLSGNECGANGGGIAFMGAVVIQFSSNMMFSENHAGVSGGALYMSGVSFGPLLNTTKFYSNSAVVGGGVYATGSGTAAVGNEDEDLQQNPTVFKGCEFIGNWATNTGGAMNTGAGIDEIVDTSFVYNSAKIGGALRLVGVANIEECKFVDNISDEDEGPGMFNDGTISGVSSCSFDGNVFNCPPGTYLDYNKTDALFDTICKGCEIQCKGCTIEGREPICLEKLGHTSTAGGNATIESLSIDRGYWRATNTSVNILTCYNPEACIGGVTGGDAYCDVGYEGPYCSICSNGYIASLGFTCTKCSGNTAATIAIAIVVVTVALFAFVSLISYMISGKREDTDKGIVARVTRCIPLQSVKVVIVVWQIVTQFSTVANVVFPSVYQDFLDSVDILNFDLSWVISIGCVVDIDFHDKLLYATLGPLVAMAILGGTYTVAMRKTGISDYARGIVRRKHVSMVLLLTFLIYSSVSSTLFKMFACDDLDDGKRYLRADYRIDCDSSKHIALQTYAGFMVVLYVVGIPGLYGVLLYNNRVALKMSVGRERDNSIKSITDLWQPYRPDRFYYEVIECARRVLLTGALVFIYPNTAAQIAVAIMIATFFIFVSEALAPHASFWDTWCSRAGHGIVFTSFFLALLLKMDVSGERSSSQRVFEIVLIAAHSCLILIVVVESVAMLFAWRKEVVSKDTEPRVRSGRSISSSRAGNNQGFLVAEYTLPFEERYRDDQEARHTVTA